jgi:hypothetical protein
MILKGNHKVNISQSLIKNIWAYMYEGACGVQLRDVDILYKYDKELTDAMKSGNYFEYLSTGQKQRDGSVPEAVVTTKGVLTADSKRAVKQAANFTKMLHAHGIEVTDTGAVITHDDLKIIVDAMVTTPVHEEAILDIKFSGLLGNKWEPMGWTEESYAYKHKLTIQPIFYKYVYWKEKGLFDVPFFYAIHSSKNENDYDMWEINIPNFEAVVEELEKEIKVIRSFLGGIDELQARPEMKRCAKCAMFNTCVYKVEVPSIKRVSLFELKNQSDKK